jgi:hypothetical protein
MGMPAEPDIANLFAAWYEARFPNEFYEHTLVFKRYIDDIFCLVTADSLDHCAEILRNYHIPGLKLNWEISETKAVFLDLEIWRNPFSYDHVLKYKPYRKPGNNFERLHTVLTFTPAASCSLQIEVHRFAACTYLLLFINRSCWLKDLYISCYPCKNGHGLIKSSKLSHTKSISLGIQPEDAGRRYAGIALKSPMNCKGHN